MDINEIIANLQAKMQQKQFDESGRSRFAQKPSANIPTVNDGVSQDPIADQTASVGNWKDILGEAANGLPENGEIQTVPLGQASPMATMPSSRMRVVAPENVVSPMTSLPTGYETAVANRDKFRQTQFKDGQIIDKDREQRDAEGNIIKSGKGSALRNFLKGLGIGALSGMRNGLGGMIGGAITGGIVNAKDGTMDEQWSYNRKVAPMEQEIARQQQLSDFNLAQLGKQANVRNTTADTVGKYEAIDRQNQLADATIADKKFDNNLNREKFDFDQEYKTVRNQLGKQKADKWAEVQDALLELKSRGLDQTDERIKLIEQGLKDAKAGKELDNKTRLEIEKIKQEGADRRNSATIAGEQFKTDKIIKAKTEQEFKKGLNVLTTKLTTSGLSPEEIKKAQDAYRAENGF
jgi:hypothetical protein